MAGYKIQANYDDLAKAADHFSKHADHSEQLMRQVEGCYSSLERGDWIGVGAQRFFQEMQQLVFPGMKRLIRVLHDASSATKKISETLKQAEDEAGGLFRQGGGAGSFAALASSIISGLSGDSSFRSMADNISRALGGGGFGSNASFSDMANAIMRGTGGAGGSFDKMADNIINSLNGGKFSSFGDLANSIVGGLRSGGDSFNDLANSIIGDLRGSRGPGSESFGQLADEIVSGLGRGGGGGSTGGGGGGGPTGGGGGGSPSSGGGSSGGGGGGDSGGGGFGGGNSMFAGGGVSGGGGAATGAASEALARIAKLNKLRAAIAGAVSQLTGMSAGQLGATLGGVIGGQLGASLGGLLGGAVGSVMGAANTGLNVAGGVREIGESAKGLGLGS